jgi:hypothetical protein
MAQTEYIYRLTVAVPEQLMAAANHFAVAVGEMAGDFETFMFANWQDEQGNKYSLMSTMVTPLLFQFAGTQLTKRPFAPDDWSFLLATQAQMAINLWFGPTEQQPTQPSVSVNNIVGVVGDDVAGVVERMGLTRVGG